MEETAQRRAVVVLGMHRSGTSAVAGCLQRLGVDFGPRLMPPNPDNARGFYEHIDIVNLHDRLLLAVNASWDDTSRRPPNWPDPSRTARFREDLRELLRRDFASAPLWGVKDPRLCRLVPWWEPLWAELGTKPLYVIVLRDPREVAASLARRDGFSPGKAYLLWLLHIMDAERHTRGRDRVFLNFSDFLVHWPRSFRAIGDALGLPWPLSPPEDAFEDGFVDPALPRSQREPLSGEVPPWIAEVDAILRTARGSEEEIARVLDGIWPALQAAQALFAGCWEGSSDAGRELVAARQQAQWYEMEWQKARRRVDTLKGKLERKTQELSKLHSQTVEIERNVAKMRIENVANVRKRQGWLALFVHWLSRF